MHSSFQLGLLLLALLASPVRSQDQCATDVYAHLAENQNRLKQNLFNVLRDLDWYERDLGKVAVDQIISLRPGQQWIDMGAGLGRAARQYKTQIGGRGKVKLVGYEKPPSYELETLLLNHADSVEYVDKQYVEDIPAAKLGKTRVITDLYGPMSYTHRPADVLRQYGTILEEGGSAHILVANKYTLIRVGKDGSVITLTEFVRRYCKGFDVASETAKGTNLNVDSSAIHLVRNKDPISIPALKTITFKVNEKGSGAPKREFYLDLPN